MVPTLLCALAVAAPAADSERVEVDLTLDGGHDAIGYGGSMHATGSALSLDGAADATLYLRPVVDEARPFALQPFLQRTSTLRLSAQLGDRAAVEPPAGSPPSREGLGATGRRGGAIASGELFVLPSLALTFAVGYRFVAPATVGAATIHFLPASAGLALRLGDLRLAIAVETVAASSAPAVSAASSFGASFTDANVRGRLSLRIVFLEHIDVHLGASANAHGVDAYLHGTFYPSQRLGLSGGGFGGGIVDRVVFPDAGDARFVLGHSPVPFDGAAHFGLFIGFSYFASRALGVAARYTATFIADGAQGETDQRVLLSLIFRGG